MMDVQTLLLKESQHVLHFHLLHILSELPSLFTTQLEYRDSLFWILPSSLRAPLYL